MEASTGQSTSEAPSSLSGGRRGSGSSTQQPAWEHLGGRTSPDTRRAYTNAVHSGAPAGAGALHVPDLRFWQHLGGTVVAAHLQQSGAGSTALHEDEAAFLPPDSVTVRPVAIRRASRGGSDLPQASQTEASGSAELGSARRPSAFSVASSNAGGARVIAAVPVARALSPAVDLRYWRFQGGLLQSGAGRPVSTGLTPRVQVAAPPRSASARLPSQRERSVDVVYWRMLGGRLQKEPREQEEEEASAHARRRASVQKLAAALGSQASPGAGAEGVGAAATTGGVAAAPAVAGSGGAAETEEEARIRAEFAERQRLKKQRLADTSPHCTDVLEGCTVTRKKQVLPRHKLRQHFDGRLLMLYFGAWSPPCEAFNPLLYSLYYQLQNREGAAKVEIVFASSDTTRANYAEMTKRMPWCLLPFNDPHVALLATRFEVVGVPSLVLIDTDGTTVCNDVSRFVYGDPEGMLFPWRPVPFWDIIDAECEMRWKDEDLDWLLFDRAPLRQSQYIGIYISAMWADNPTGFNKQLVATYQALRQRGVALEILFASVDRSYKEYRLFRELMPWLVLPYGDRREALLTQRFNISGIPALVIVDALTGNVVNADARPSVHLDPLGLQFPWLPKLLLSVDEAAGLQLDTSPCLILLLDGADGVVGKASMTTFQASVMEHASKWRLEGKDKHGKAPLVFVFGDEDMDLTWQLRGFLQLNDVPAPNLVILDVPAQKKYIWVPEKRNSDNDTYYSDADRSRAGSVAGSDVAADTVTVNEQAAGHSTSESGPAVELQPGTSAATSVAGAVNAGAGGGAGAGASHATSGGAGGEGDGESEAKGVTGGGGGDGGGGGGEAPSSRGRSRMTKAERRAAEQEERRKQQKLEDRQRRREERDRRKREKEAASKVNKYSLVKTRPTQLEKKKKKRDKSGTRSALGKLRGRSKGRSGSPAPRSSSRRRASSSRRSRSRSRSRAGTVTDGGRGMLSPKRGSGRQATTSGASSKPSRVRGGRSDSEGDEDADEAPPPGRDRGGGTAITVDVVRDFVGGYLAGTLEPWALFE